MAETISTTPAAASEERLERAVQRIAAAGMAVCTVLLILGLFRVLTAEASPAERARPDTAQLFRRLGSLDGVDLIDLGLLVLISTPVARVAMLGAGWLAMGQRRFAAIAAVVLCLLLAGVWLGAR